MAKTALKTTRRKPSAVQDSHYEALAAFRLSLRTFLSFSEAAAEKIGLTPQQHQAILAIRGLADGKGATVGELASYLLLKPHTAGELADRLVQAGLVIRTPDPDDGRKVRLMLTRKANTALKALSDKHLMEIRRNAPELIRLLQRLSRD